MPDCPKCKVIIAFSEDGPVCPECRHRFSAKELHDLPDYEFFKVTFLMELFIGLMEKGRIDNQLYYMEVLRDGLILLPLGVRLGEKIGG